jgi:hypothetical protein
MKNDPKLIRDKLLSTEKKMSSRIAERLGGDLGELLEKGSADWDIVSDLLSSENQEAWIAARMALHVCDYEVAPSAMKSIGSHILHKDQLVRFSVAACIPNCTLSDWQIVGHSMYLLESTEARQRRLATHIFSHLHVLVDDSIATEFMEKSVDVLSDDKLAQRHRKGIAQYFSSFLSGVEFPGPTHDIVEVSYTISGLVRHYFQAEAFRPSEGPRYRALISDFFLRFPERRDDVGFLNMS